uniref:Anaphase-promoting complex subunit 10 n=1 Tax=Rhabditophanes sp. KR3021 TaxID=114890 RepID=A0AC35TNL1_9BILA
MLDDEDGAPSSAITCQSNTDPSWRKYIPSDATDVKNISDEAIWSLSSCKDGFGINQLLDEQVDMYWQSDGQQPHRISIEFQKLTEVCFVMFYLDFKTDESYTPSKIMIQSGTNSQDVHDQHILVLSEPIGWQIVDLRNEKTRMALKSFMLNIQVIHNHQNGRDTHIRSIRVIGPPSIDRALSQKYTQRKNQVYELEPIKNSALNFNNRIR